VKPTTILGWSIENPGRRSHVIGTTDIVVGTRSPATVTVASSLCGTRNGGSVQAEPNQVPCARCLDIAFKLARTDDLPDMVHAFEEDKQDAARVHGEQEDIAHCAKCGQAEDRPIHRIWN
jgi:hypothetical protein